VSDERLSRLDRAHIVHPHQVVGRAPEPLVVESGRGAVITDVDGNEYIDGTCGLWQCLVGHGREELAEVASAQMRKLEFYASFWDYSNRPAIELAERLAQIAPPGIDHVFFTNGGSEGTETAIKLARLAWSSAGQPDRNLILSRKMAYHGVGYGSLSATGIPPLKEGFGPLAEGFVHLTAPYPLRVPDCTNTCIAELEETIERLGAGRIAAMIGEPVLGVAGMIPPPDDYWPAADAKADAKAWKKTVEGFRRDRAALEKIAANPRVALGSALPYARQHTLIRELLIVSEHNTYHIGELAILRQVMGTWPARR